MKKVKILDTTLRDGGRVIDCAFIDEHIKGIAKNIALSGIEIVEMGFLRGNINYDGNSTFFTELEQVKQFIPQTDGNTMFVVFSDYGKEYGMWDFSRIKPCDGKTITGFRVGYRKKDLHNAIDTFKIVKDNGYKLFIQGVESLNYTDKEMLDAIEVINDISPYAFGIVDTYGRMYKKDVFRFYDLLDRNLDEGIALDFHFHNNMQLAFSFAQEVVEMRKGSRDIIIDATLEGVTRGAGNLNTELIVEYLNREHSCTYDIDRLLDTIDEYIYGIKKNYSWSYSIPQYIAGIYSSHSNNIDYLMDKHKLSTKDIRHIISMIEPEKRKRYDYDNIEKLYVEYYSSKADDTENIQTLQDALRDKNILVLVPGHSLARHDEQISKFIAEEKPVVISVNFLSNKSPDSYAFFGNPRRYKNIIGDVKGEKLIITSNIVSENQSDIVVNYNSLIDRDYKYFDNSTIMLLNLLRKAGVKNISIAGLDGLAKGQEIYYQKGYNTALDEEEFDRINADLEKMLRSFSKTLGNKHVINFITPSRFAKIFSDNN